MTLLDNPAIKERVEDWLADLQVGPPDTSRSRRELPVDTSIDFVASVSGRIETGIDGSIPLVSASERPRANQLSEETMEEVEESEVALEVPEDEPKTQFSASPTTDPFSLLDI